MINDPIFRNYPHPSRKTRPVPIHQSHRYPLPYVVPAPIQFVRAKQPQKLLWISKQSATLKIQKVYRGFRVRKSLKKIAVIRKQVIEIERRVNDNEIVELIRKDKKERLRVNERLMCLLLTLDSIHGVDFGVREFRKGVCSKAIELQERVDSIVESKKKSVVSCVEIVDDFVENQSVEIGCEIRPESSTFRNEFVDSQNENVELVCEIVDNDALLLDKSVEIGYENHEIIPVIDDSPNLIAAVVADDDVLVDVPMKVANEMDDHYDPDESIDDEKRNTQMLEKLLDDNEKMITLMTQMFERNEMQTWMLSSLSQRVEQMEKSFTCDRCRRKKRKRNTA